MHFCWTMRANNKMNATNKASGRPNQWRRCGNDGGGLWPQASRPPKMLSIVLLCSHQYPMKLRRMLIL